jgi:hypothetical protein
MHVRVVRKASHVFQNTFRDRAELELGPLERLPVAGGLRHFRDQRSECECREKKVGERGSTASCSLSSTACYPACVPDWN